MPADSDKTVVLVLYDSQGLVAELAKSIIEGAASVDGIEVWDRPLDIADKDELVKCDALILGSPNWTGITGRLKHWWDYTGDLWESGELADKPAAAFSAGWSPSGGLEATLLQLVHLLIGHGMLIVGSALDLDDEPLRQLLRSHRRPQGHRSRPRTGPQARRPSLGIRAQAR